MTIIQRTPIKGDGENVNIGLGSIYSRELGLGDTSEYDASSNLDTGNAADDADESKQDDVGKKAGGKKKKKSNKKKKK
jgi:hypothetical protein